MDSSLLSEQHSPAGMTGVPALALLLERGLDYVQRGCYAEGAALLTLVREQLPPEQAHLSDVLDMFLHRYAGYQHVQHTLQEASGRFSEARAELQAHATAFGRELLIFIGNIDTPRPSPTPPTDPVDPQSPPPCLPSLDRQGSLSSPTLQPFTKDNTPLHELSITCFGHFEVRRLNRPIALCSNRNGQTILRYLIAQSGHLATIDTLMAMLWPEDEPEVAQPKLHIAISALRRSLNHGYNCEAGGGYILCKNRVYRLNPAVVIQTDVDEFLQWYQLGQRMSERKVSLYERACHLYAGPFLTEDVYADWSFLQREQLSQTYLTMCKALADCFLQSKSYEDAAKWATTILKENRCDEAAHRLLIQIYAAQGRRSEALQQYQRCERMLREELGVRPLPETTLVFQRFLTTEQPHQSTL